MSRTITLSDDLPKLQIPRTVASGVKKWFKTSIEPCSDEKNWDMWYRTVEDITLLILPDEVESWLMNGDSRQSVLIAYLNPLTRPFVEVVDE